MTMPHSLFKVMPDGVVEVLLPFENPTQQIIRDLFGDLEPIEDDTFFDLLNKLDEIDFPPK